MKNKITIKQKIFLILLGVTLILGGLELFLRLHPAFGYRYAFCRFESENFSNSKASHLQPSDLLGYEHIPNSRPNINSYGLVGREYSIKKDKNIFRILLLGDSIAEQGYSAEFLEAKLNDKARLYPEQRFEVWNAGVGSYEVRRYTLYLEHIGLRYMPDMVIIFLFMNDFGMDTTICYKTKNGIIKYYFPIPEITKFYNPNPILMKHSYLYRFVILRLDSFLKERKGDLYVNMEEDGRYYLNKIKEICQKKNIPLFIVIFPYIRLLNEYEDWQRAEYSVICKVVKESKIPYYNLFNLYERLLKEGYVLRDRDEDDVHPSEEGHRLIANEIFNYMSANFLDKI